jgi:hypothetical protein
MAKRISCKTINSVLLNGEIVSPESVCFLTFPVNFFIFDNNSDLIPGSAMYTRKLKITKMLTSNYLTPESLDFYA